MDKAARQSALDVQKWIDSEQKGYDCCGTYDFCAKCDKQAEYPCAVAYDVFNAKSVKAAKKPAAKKAEVKTEVKAEVKTAEKKPAAKKARKKASK